MTGQKQKSVALLTPSYGKDIERFALLCDSIDRHVSGYERHYVLVRDSEMALFSRFAGPRRIVLPSSHYLPSWLRLAPAVRLKHGRRVWWSFRAGLVHGWHIQQLLKCAAASQLPQERYCIIDSDNAFFRPFDVGAYAGGDRAPLYVERKAIASDAPLHAVWTRNCDRLLGHALTSFPADDYIGQDIIWDKSTVRDMTAAIERTTDMPWAQALCKTRAFSEYLLYGHFVRHSPAHLARHELTEGGIAVAYWDAVPLDAAAIRSLLGTAPLRKVALSVASFSNTPMSAIREATGFLQRPDDGDAMARAA